MAYGLKYKASKTHENGDKYEVRIYRDGWTGASYGIGNLTRLSLSIQGDTAALTAPIIKTSLNIGMIDTPDKGSTKSDGTTCVDANGDKVGKWEEFYTNNPTLYKVELRYTGALTRNAVIWTGFLTPDSWGEDMTYGGTISLVARDMLGTLSEYEFDLTGDVTITQIVQGALTKCKCAMTATMRTSECLQNAGNSQSILNAKINASTFAGKSWYDALEQTLEGVGLILRYDGNNGFDCTSIRYAASHAVEGGENAHTPAFYNRSGYRTLDPAVKQIVEVFNPSIESIAPVEPGAEDWTDTGQTLTQKFKNHLGQESTYSYPKMSLSAQGVDYSGTGALPYYENTYIYNGTTGELIPTFRAPLYIPINLQSSADFLTLKNAAFVPPFNLSFSNPMGSTGYLLFTPAEGSSPRVLTNTYSRDFEQKVRFRITCKKNGTTYYWDTSGAGVWGTTEKVLEYVTGERIQVAELEGATDYAIGVNTVVVPAPASATDFYPARAAFIPLVFEVAPIDGNDVYGEYKTTTIYDEENHIEINRTPSIGAINSSTPAAFLPNVLHYGTTPASDKWRWAGENSAGLPLAVVIHQQLLVFNCAQNGNSIFTGDLLDLTSRVSVPGTNYDYFTRSCALLAGDYNCLSGYIEGVTLREIYDWDDVWDGVTPEYTEKESQAKGGTAASGGGGSSSGGGGGSSHTHPNKEVLDGITAEKVTSWDGKYTKPTSGIPYADLATAVQTSLGKADSAYQKPTTGIPATDLAQAVQTALNKAHEHANKTSVLDKLKWDATNNAIYIGDSDNPISFYAFGEITAGGVGSGGGGGVNYLYMLEDVPDYRTSSRGKYLRVKSDGSGTEWVDVTGGVSSVINLTGDITQSQLRTALGLGSLAYLNGLSKADVGLGNVDNTADANKSVASANYAGYIIYRDTRSANPAPYSTDFNKGIEYALKLNSADGLSQGGSYHGVMTLHQWGDVSGGDAWQLGFTHNGRIYARHGESVWGGWSGLAFTSDIPSSIVNTIGGKTGAISVRGGQTANGSVNLAMSGTQLQASIVGLGNLAYQPDVVTALGYTPVNKAGDTMSGVLSMGANDIVFGGGDPGDLVWYNANNEEIHRIWSSDEGSLHYRYHNGSSRVIWHSGNLTNNNQLTNGAGYITSSGSCAYATSAGNADTLDGQHASYFATASSLGNYLPLSGGAMSGNIDLVRNHIILREILSDSSYGSGEADHYISFRTKSKYNTEKLAIGAMWYKALTSVVEADLSYVFIGKSYNDSHNLRIYQDNVCVGSNTIYHSGNCNNTSTPWSASSLTLSGAISGATTITASGGISCANLTASGLVYGSRGSSNIASFMHNRNGSYWCGWGYDGVINHTRIGPCNVDGSWVNNTTIDTLDVYGSLSVTNNIVASGEVTAGGSSDIRLKDNIQSISRNTARNIVNRLRGVTFTWNELATSLASQNKGDSVGFVAQEIQPLIPSAIGTIFDKYLRLDTTKIIPYAVTMLQDHDERIAQLERENAELKRQLQHLNS